MKKDTENDVFETYRQLRDERALLKSMLMHLEELTEEDIIVSMNYEKPDELKGMRCIGSNHVSYIAMNYQREFGRRYESELMECFERFMIVDKKLAAIEAGVKLLPMHLQKFVKYYIDDGMTWFEIENQMNISHSSVGRWKKQAAEKLNKCLEIIG